MIYIVEITRLGSIHYARQCRPWCGGTSTLRFMASKSAPHTIVPTSVPNILISWPLIFPESSFVSFFASRRRATPSCASYLTSVVDRRIWRHPYPTQPAASPGFERCLPWTRHGQAPSSTPSLPWTLLAPRSNGNIITPLVALVLAMPCLSLRLWRWLLPIVLSPTPPPFGEGEFFYW